MIEFKSVSLNLGGRQLLDGLDWELPDPGKYLILGGTGAGKSLLTRIMTRQQKPSRGNVVIDGEPLYRLIGGYGDPLFYASAEQAVPEMLSVEEHLAQELNNLQGQVKDLEDIWPELEPRLPHGRNSKVGMLSHGELLLVQTALAAAAPVRVTVLDGHLTYMDSRSCEAAVRILKLAVQQQERFIILTASRLAYEFDSTWHRVLCDGRIPVRPAAMSNSITVDTGVAPVGPGGNLRVYYGVDRINPGGVTSGKFFTVKARLENGVLLEPTGTIDEVLNELAVQGFEPKRIELE